MKRLKENKIFKIITTIIKVIVAIVLIGFVLVVCLQRFSDNKISIFNYRMFTVVSGSMKPTYDIGDVLIAKEVKPTDVEVGDDISYQGEVGGFKNKVITHRVTQKYYDKETEKWMFRAQGLANALEDPIISEDQLYGVVMFKSLILSTIYRIIGTNIGFYLFIIIPLLYVVGSEIIGFLLDKEEKRRKKKK